jgi:predicted DNA-binding transcriptional regulator AlpA
MNLISSEDRNKIIRIRTVCEYVGLSRATINRYVGMDPPRFPRAIKIGISAVGWRLGAVMDFLDEREAESKQRQSIH